METNEQGWVNANPRLLTCPVTVARVEDVLPPVIIPPAPSPGPEHPQKLTPFEFPP